MKKIVYIFLVTICSLLLLACGEKNSISQLQIPDVVDITITDGKNVISSMGIIPYIEYEYNDTIAPDNIIRSIPNAGETINKGEKVTLIVSKGPEMLRSKDSYANWTYITYGVKDNWEFSHPYIKDNTLYIECNNVTFGTAMTWRDRYNEGCASGTACINDTFDKVVPVRLEFTKPNFLANESQSFKIKVPLENLDVKKPSNMYFKIGINVGGQDRDLLFNFSMTW